MNESLRLIKIAELLGVNIIVGTPDAIFDMIVEQLKNIPYVPFPLAFHPVDIIVTRPSGLKTEILLGKKKNGTAWVFIGGFVDPKESAEAAALRELFEETCIKITDESRLKYIGSSFVDDSRFSDCHKVTSSIFTIRLQHSEWDLAKGGDDIVEVKWFPLEDVFDNLSEHHKPILIKYLLKK